MCGIVSQQPEGFSIRLDETESETFRRIVIAEMDKCVSLLSDTSNLDFGVHETRKATKRARAVLRIVRPGIGEPDFRDENAAVRDAARALSPLREAAVRGVTVRRLGAEYSRLAEQFDLDAETTRKVFVNEGLLHPVVASFEACRIRFDEQIRWEGVDADPLSMIVGIERTFRQGRSQRRIAAAFPDPVSLHELRKQVKHLRHQMEVFTPIELAEVGGYARSLDRLGEILGEHHDISDLMRTLSRGVSEVPAALLRGLRDAAKARQVYLQEEALPLSRVLYSESPATFRKRLLEYWRGWRSSA